MAVALDSDAVIGFLDAGDALHQAADSAIRDLLKREQLVVSAVTYAEVLTGARLGHHDEAVIVAFFADLVSAVNARRPVSVAQGKVRAIGQQSLCVLAAALDRELGQGLLMKETRLGEG